LGDDPAQHRITVDVIEARLCRMKEEKEQATVALNQTQEEVIKQRLIA
jgi:hypothetical protein